MKGIKYIISLILAFALCIGVVSTGFADGNEYQNTEAKIQAIQSYLTQVNQQHNLNLYVLEEDIANPDVTVEATKTNIDLMVQELLTPAEFSPEEDLNQGISLYDGSYTTNCADGKIRMTIFYTTYSSPLRFKEVTSCSSKGINGWHFEAPMGFKAQYSNNRKTVTVTQNGFLRAELALGCAPVWYPSYNATASFSL